MEFNVCNSYKLLREYGNVSNGTWQLLFCTDVLDFMI
jgi:hypothetical protein